MPEFHDSVTIAHRFFADPAVMREHICVSAVLEVLLAEAAVTQTRFACLAALARARQAEFEPQRATGE